MCVLSFYCADNNFNPTQSGTSGRDRHKSMHNAHLQQTHKHYAPRCCFHSQAYSISPLLAITIHLKLPPIVHTTHLPALPKPYIGLKESLNCFSLGDSSTKSSVARVQWQQRRKCGQIQRNNTLPTMSPLFREKLQKRGCWRTTVYMDRKDVFTSESLRN